MKELLTEFLSNLLKEEREVRKPGTVWQTASKKWSAKRADGTTETGFESEERARLWMQGKVNKMKPRDDFKGRTPKAQPPVVVAKKSKEPVVGTGRRGKPIGSDIPKDLLGRNARSRTEPTISTGMSSSPEVQEATRGCYGSAGTGPLLQGEDSDAQRALDNGYVKGESWVAPGNPGSCFNETISNEGVQVLEQYPDLNEEQLTEVLFQRTRASTLGRQQSSSGFPPGLKVPKEITDKKERDIYRNCILAARSARTKFKRSQQGEVALRDAGIFSGDVARTTYGGTAQNKEELTTAIQEASTVYVYDEELGTVEIPKEQLIEWVQSSGGGENAADTVTLTMDENGNVLYDGWSDKKTLSDIQANSTLKYEFDKATELLDTICKSGRSDTGDCERARTIIEDGSTTVRAIESEYADLTAQMAGYFLDLPMERLSVLGQAARDYAGSGNDPGTQAHFNSFTEQMDKFMNGTMPKGRLRTALETFFTENSDLRNVPEEQRIGVYFKAISYVARQTYENPKTGERKHVLSADFRKVVDRMGNREIREIKQKGEQIPPALDTSEQMSQLRRRAFDVQRQTMENLNQIPATSSNGVETTLGALIGFEDAMQSLHLDKINPPDEGESSTRQILRRNTQLVMEGVAVTPKTLRECLGVNNTGEIEDNFELIFEERFRYSDEQKTKVSGKVVVIYAINKEGRKTEIGERTYRPKDGPTSPTATTVTWSEGMQDCFESKSNG